MHIVCFTICRSCVLNNLNSIMGSTDSMYYTLTEDIYRDCTKLQILWNPYIREF